MVHIKRNTDAFFYIDLEMSLGFGFFPQNEEWLIKPNGVVFECFVNCKIVWMFQEMWAINTNSVINRACLCRHCHIHKSNFHPKAFSRRRFDDEEEREKKTDKHSVCGSRFVVNPFSHWCKNGRLMACTYPWDVHLVAHAVHTNFKLFKLKPKTHLSSDTIEYKMNDSMQPRVFFCFIFSLSLSLWLARFFSFCTFPGIANNKSMKRQE